MSSKVFRLGELFCGPGGLALGAARARVTGTDGTVYRIEHTWANDIDPSACATYNANIKPDTAICMPVQQLDISALDKINALTFGFPCNDYSIVGEQRGLQGDYGPLYMYGVKVLNAHSPEWFLAENVSGLQNADDGQAFDQITAALRGAGHVLSSGTRVGYQLTVHLYRFEDYGVPQQRHRIIIVGIRKDLGLTFQVPAPTTKGNPVTVRQALAEPIPDGDRHSELTRQSANVVERLKHIPPGGNAWHENIPQHLRLNVKGATLSQIYKRLDPDRPSYTITGSGGGGTHGYHWQEPRALTNRERARIQTFPDDYDFQGPKESVRKQIGMAVPPVGAQVIFEAILKTFAGMSYAAVPPRWPSPGPSGLLFSSDVSQDAEEPGYSVVNRQAGDQA